LTIDASHLLVFQVTDVKRLYDQFGTTAVRTGLADTITALDAHASGLLGRHQEMPLPPSTVPTRWWRGFTMTGAGSALMDASEQAEALAAAASATGHRVLLDIFGAATGGRLAFAAAVIPLPAPVPADIDAWLDQAWRDDTSHRADLAPDADAALRALIAGQGLRTLLQPIVSLPFGQVVGYEALSRGPEGSALETANALFGAGERFNLTVELELACARQAAVLAARLPVGRWLSVNLGLAALATPGAVESLARPGIVLEITEHLPLDQADAYAAFFAKARALGARLALDDTGCGFADIDAARAIHPDIAKLCITVIRNANRSSAHLAEIARAVAELRSAGAEVLAEGVETPEQATALTEAGASLAQGWHFGRPVPCVEIVGSLGPNPRQDEGAIAPLISGAPQQIV
jgi:EAL domain-containing protein (putative c-di-GMP-specific phosphodiesterase class I)